VEGTIRIAYDARKQELDPNASPVYVDLTGTTTFHIARAGTFEAGDYYDAVFHIQGTPRTDVGTSERPVALTSSILLGQPGGLTISVRTDPPLPGGQIEALIRQQVGVEGFGTGGNNVVEALGGQFAQALAGSVVSSFTAPIENALESALGLDIFSIDVGPAQPVRVRIGKRLFGNLFGTVSQEFATTTAAEPPQRSFDLYYRLTPRLRIGFERQEPAARQFFFFSGTASF
jgi:hypothetical protein